MSDIVDFIRARLDEDVQAANVAAAVTAVTAQGYPWLVDHNGDIQTPVGTLALGQEDGWLVCGTEVHIARHDPARVLREVASKTAIVDRCEDLIGHPSGDETTDICCELILLDLAAAFSDHADYRQEWKPK